MTISPKQKGTLRLLEIRRILIPYWEKADLVVIEDYAYSRAGAHSHEIGELGGVVRVSLMDDDILFATVVPSSLKKFATGKGNANKQEMAVAAYKEGKMEFKDDNQCDAWWLMHMGLYHLGGRFITQTSYRDESVKKLVWP